MQSFDDIDRYFNKEMAQDEILQFDNRIQSDPLFAEEVAFYISVKMVAKEEAEIERKKRFRALGSGRQKNGIVRSMTKQWGYAAAAVLVSLVIGIYLFTTPAEPSKLAEQYIKQELGTLGVSMSSGQVKIQTGLGLYNSKAYDKALQQFEEIFRNDSSSFTAIQYAGLSALQLNNYDKALTYFSLLENFTGLYANPGKFYRALTLMKRNDTGDRETAKQLLEEVVNNDLEGKAQAEEWLRKM